MTIQRFSVQLDYSSPAGGPAFNTWHARNDTTLAETTTQDLADVLHLFYDSIKSLYPSLVTVKLASIVDVETQEEDSATWTNIVGTGTANSAPSGLAYTISWRTSIAARRARGRTFIGPLPSGAMDGSGTPPGASLITLQAAADALIATSVGLTEAAFGVWGLENKAPAGTVDYSGLPRVLRDFQSASIKDKWAHLSSRRD